MKVFQILNEESDEEIHKRIAAEKAILTKLYDVKKEIKSRGSSGNQRGLSPEYENMFQQANSMINVSKEKLQHLQSIIGVESNIDNWHKRYEDKYTASRDERLKDTQSAGQQNTNTLLKRHGGWSGLAKAAEKFVDLLTDHGKDPLDVSRLADKFNVTPRTMYKWFERPAFKLMRKHLATNF